MFEKILEEIRRASRVIIHRHQNPDGDALGSQIGLRRLLELNFPEKKIYTVGDAAKRYAFMDGSKMDNITDGVYEGALAVILDTGAASMISDDRYRLAARSVRLDHHIFCEKIADEEVVDPSFESSCGLVTAFAMECGLRVDPACAKALYVGMVTDSGRFRYDSTSSGTFRRAAFLMEQPFETADIYANLYVDDLDAMRLRAKYILKIQTTASRVAYVYTTAEELRELGDEVLTNSRSFVNTMSDLRGIDVWANFIETSDGVICELRSSKYNVNPVAVKYGGGGHARASGATVRDRDEAMRVLEDLNQLTAGEKYGE